MKRTCLNCKALKESQGESFNCLLNYKMNDKKGIPMEDCPKPKTYSTFFEEMKIKEKLKRGNK